MAFFSDSPLLLASLLLAAAGFWVWRAARGVKAALRLNLRFAVALLMVPAWFGFAVALFPILFGAAQAVMGLALALADSALGLGFAGPRPAPAWAGCLALCGALAAGLFSLLSGEIYVVLLAQLIAAAALAALLMWHGVGPGKTRGAVGAVLIAAASLAWAEQALAGSLALLAAGLFALPLKLPVETRRQVQDLPISGAGAAGHGALVGQYLA
jgi:hypothetical protein